MPDETNPINWAPWITAIASLCGAFGGAFFGQMIARRNSRASNDKRDLALISSLIAEVQHCGHLAAMYLKGKYAAPAYRLHTKIYDSSLPTLAGTVLTDKDVDSLISFYSHVDQVNRLLDEVHELLRGAPNSLAALPANHPAFSEISRLRLKAGDTQEPDSKFYTPALNALKARQNELKGKMG
jgi:hypothetical protein